MLAQRGQEEEPTTRPHLLQLMRVGVECPQQARGEGDGGGAVREEGGVAVQRVCVDDQGLER